MSVDVHRPVELADRWSMLLAEAGEVLGGAATGGLVRADGPLPADGPADVVLLGGAAPSEPEPERANLTMSMRHPARRRDLRRFLVAIGAVRGAEVTSVEEGSLPTDQVVARLMRLETAALRHLLGRAGMITSAERVERFAAEIGALVGEHDPADPVEVHVWLGKVGAILRTTT